MYLYNINQTQPYYRQTTIYCPNTNQNSRPLFSNKVQMPTPQRNYCLFDQNKVDFFVKRKELSIPYLSGILARSNDEREITESLYIVDRMIDNGTRGVDKMYPVLSRFNMTNSPNIQTFLAGIYRKIQVPDAFGPLIAMLIRNALNPQPSCFDPNEEVGGAILAYLSDRFKG